MITADIAIEIFLLVTGKRIRSMPEARTSSLIMQQDSRVQYKPDGSRVD